MDVTFCTGGLLYRFFVITLLKIVPALDKTFSFLLDVQLLNQKRISNDLSTKHIYSEDLMGDDITRSVRPPGFYQLRFLYFYL